MASSSSSSRTVLGNRPLDPQGWRSIAPAGVLDRWIQLGVECSQDLAYLYVGQDELLHDVGPLNAADQVSAICAWNYARQDADRQSLVSGKLLADSGPVGPNGQGTRH